MLDASAVNQPVDLCEVSSITNMESRFSHASSINQLIGTWDVSSELNMQPLFRDASFSQPASALMG
jgi:hypothetical protein